MPIKGCVANSDGFVPLGRERLIGYLRVAAAEAELLGDHHLEDRISRLISRVAGSPARRERVHSSCRGERL